MLARLSKTLSTTLPTNIAIGGLSLLLLGAGGTGATLAAGKSPVPTPNADATTAEQAQEDAREDDAAESEQDEASESTRPTDTHGYCVSQVAKTETTGDVNHGSLVSAAAHACGKEGKESKESKAERAAAKAAAKAQRDAEKAARKAARDADRDDEADDEAAESKRGKA